MRRVFTANSHFGTKTRLRAEACRHIAETKDVGSLYILDAFAGEGHVWQRVAKMVPNLTITYLGIDKKKYSRPEVIMGNNQKVMKGLDLTQFDLIDLDAFGCPWEQLEIAAAQAPEVPVVSTCIFVDLAPVPKPLIAAAGIPEEWKTTYEVPQVLFARWRWQLWENYLGTLGYKTTDYELHLDKSAVKRYEILSR